MSLRAKLATVISAFTEFTGRVFAPATPWLFLSLRRALIATVCWLLLACFFFLVPQSREVLHGLSEAPLTSIYDFQGEVERLVNTWALFAYAAMSVLVSLVVWYAARLLSAVDSAFAMPPALASSPDSERLASAMVWLPRVLGVSALASCIGALIYANYTPQLRQWAALALSFGAVVAPILVAGAALAVPRNRSTRLALGLLGAVAFVVIVAVLCTVEQKWRMQVWSVALALLPALLLVILVKRYDIFVRMKLDVSGMSATSRQFGDEVVTVLVMLGSSVVALLALAFTPVAVVRGFGSGATVLLFLASAVLLLTAVQLVLRRIARQVPGFTTATVIVVLVVLIAFGREPVGTEQLPLARAVGDAKFSPPASGGPRLYINAWGGGLRAAVFTAEVLALADDTTCGAFGSRIAAMSGVSGGSLGIATYLIARQEIVAKGAWQQCVAGPAAKTPLTDIVTRALVQDHLSPPIARLLAVDAWRAWGSPMRGQAMLDSWNSALAAALASNDDHGPLAMRLSDLTGGIAPPPSVYLNATDADTGGIVYFLNRPADPTDRAFADAYPVGLALLHSARFPVVTPAGSFVERGPRMRLVDGGYADDSGATSLHKALEGASAARKLIDIDGNPPQISVCEHADDLSSLPTAVRALLEAREARASDAVTQFAAEVDKPAIHVRLDLEQVYGVRDDPDAHASRACEKVRRSQRAPLGWYVSYGAAKTIAASAQFGVEQIIAALDIKPMQTLAPIAPAK